MTHTDILLPQIVSRDEWLVERKKHLAHEKELTRQIDALYAERRRLPMVAVDKPYLFSGPEGSASLLDLFGGRRQLVVYHFMFDPHDPPEGRSGAPWDEGCPGCSFVADSIPHLAHLHARETSLVLVSRAPWNKIAPFKARMGWTVPWYSSFDSDFNYDFHVTLDEAKSSLEWNYRSAQELKQAGKIPDEKGELPGLSVFLRNGERVFHTYSTYARGLEVLLGAYHYLDLTPFGRGEGWGGMPDLGGQGQNWLRHHDRYEIGRTPEGCCHARASLA
ncbi:DUF899 domain-containing protein [Methylococcus sp. EFPC2]|uniref:DUF899 domain-containing protein n=1 Tax=Methylococcus sp. EFPC2 TaxID=2812648 RepID=UPI001967D173|nr:DUF899 domain-containing protein [Methylococcus sp. EFPC2]QSA97904.1 DUF899 domain-containing protein [Methylococcus sp. EFPC2]